MHRLERTAPLWILAVVLMITYWRLFIGEAFFWALPSIQFVPWRALGFDMLRAGHLPLWNPYNGAGSPLFANYQSGFLYPLNWFGILAPDNAALGWWMSVTAVIHLFIGGWGMWCFTGRLNYSLLGRGVSALAYALTSYTVGRLGTYPTISVAAWLPFLLWAVHGVMLNGTRRSLGILALIVGMVLTAGHAQTAWYGLLLTGFYALWRWGHSTIQWRTRTLRLGLALLAVILGVGMASLQLIATAELTLNSQRSTSYGDEAAALAYSYSPIRTVNFLAPNIFGNPGDGSYLPTGVFYEEAVYIGLIPLIAALVSLFAPGAFRTRNPSETRSDPDISGQRAGDSGQVQISACLKPDSLAVGLATNGQFNVRDRWFWGGVLLIGFVLALGKNTPVFLLLYRYVPTFDMFQAPGRWHIWTIIALSVLAGMGVERWGTGKWVIFWTRLVTAGAIGGVLVVMVSALYAPPDLLAIEGVGVLIHVLVLTALWVALAGILTLLKRENVPERFHPLPTWWDRAWAVAVLGVVAADVGWAARGLNPTVPAVFYHPQIAAVADPTQRGYWTEEALDRLLFGQEFDEDGDLVILEEDDLGYQPWLDGSDYQYAQKHWQEYRALNLPNMNILDRQYLLNNFDPLLLNSYATLIETLPDAEVMVEQGALIDDWDYGVDRLYTDLGGEPLVNAGSRVVLENGTAEMVVVADGYNETAVFVQNAERDPDVDGELMVWLLDQNPAGWEVTVNTQPAPIADSVFHARGVAIDEGSSELRFIYRPSWVLPGMVISGISVVIGLLLLLQAKPRESSISE